MVIFKSLTDPHLIAMIRDGAVGVLPTDTLYGLVASAHNPQAVARLYALKHRERKPGTSIAGDTSQLIELGLPVAMIERVAYLWPNPISVEMHHDLSYIHHGSGRSSFRVVTDGDLRELLRLTGPLTTSSANQPGLTPATTATEAQAYFGDSVDFYVDDGIRANALPSTVIGVSEAGITVYREGAIKLNEKGQII